MIEKEQLKEGMIISENNNFLGWDFIVKKIDNELVGVPLKTETNKDLFWSQDGSFNYLKDFTNCQIEFNSFEDYICSQNEYLKNRLNDLETRLLNLEKTK